MKTLLKKLFTKCYGDRDGDKKSKKLIRSISLADVMVVPDIDIIRQPVDLANICSHVAAMERVRSMMPKLSTTLSADKYSDVFDIWANGDYTFSKEDISKWDEILERNEAYD